MTLANQSAAANRRPAGQADGSDNLAAIVAADRAFPAAVAELGSFGGNTSMSARKRIVVSLLILAAVAVGVFVWSYTRPRVVGRAVTADGIEMCVVQQFTLEGFTTSFVYRKPGGRWRWFYYDHEDDYWRSSRASLKTDSTVAVFFREGSPAVTFDWSTESYTGRLGMQTNARALPERWSPRRSVYAKR